jgi:hypothetical protein
MMAHKSLLTKMETSPASQSKHMFPEFGNGSVLESDHHHRFRSNSAFTGAILQINVKKPAARSNFA